ncbi:Crp/Fnr family transcriptional regulator [Sulfuriferula plumbiphila]|uniref:Crp/Fnr family transcriptional regulator n=1 Tax=Sulfuriferula plumbiphila TaxID=171865 RepID=A0A512LAT6_9PROT|nr:Crp/Fnr family transcriptional regulator [Sulfuriferula plumbiphila]BBP05260.1 Crp/Fnr family transcriptional regulator [Sulfuriferula plumbiphila]GEP31251.1 Crp/Fnr family transcriptional regulator [Sulfuriferula plumbiphila]
MPSTQPITSENHLLARLPRKDLEHFLARCESVHLTVADELGAPGMPIEHVYFPTDSFISLVMVIDDHSRLEVGLIGCEGMLGTPLMFGIKVASFYAVVQGAGSALRIATAAFSRELEHSAALHKRLQGYTYVLKNQFARMAACTRFHVVEQRLARLLLMIQDRARANHFHLTHEAMAHMLGVRRVGVTKAATALHRQNLISYSRGDITILDRNGLEAASCECYAAERSMYERVLG